MKEIKVVKKNPCDDCGIKGLYDDCKDECVQYRKYYQYEQGRADERNRITREVKKLETVDVEYCPHGYDDYICKDDVLIIVKGERWRE